MRAAVVDFATTVMVLFMMAFGVFTVEVIVGPDGEANVYVCEEDSPPPCMWDCTRDGNGICGGAR